MGGENPGRLEKAMATTHKRMRTRSGATCSGRIPSAKEVLPILLKFGLGAGFSRSVSQLQQALVSETRAIASEPFIDAFSALKSVTDAVLLAVIGFVRGLGFVLALAPFISANSISAESAIGHAVAFRRIPSVGLEILAFCAIIISAE